MKLHVIITTVSLFLTRVTKSHDPESKKPVTMNQHSLDIEIPRIDEDARDRVS